MAWHIAFLGKCFFSAYLRIVYALQSSAPEFYVCVLVLVIWTVHLSIFIALQIFYPLLKEDF